MLNDTFAGPQQGWVSGVVKKAAGEIWRHCNIKKLKQLN